MQGFRIFEPGTSVIDFDKPRDKEFVNNSLVPFDMGTILRVNNVFGTPFFGINNELNTVRLLSRRILANQVISGTHDIGKARVYSFGLRNTPYEDNASQWNLYLFDVQTYTYLAVSYTHLTLPTKA
mgnify:FL=1